MRALALTTRFRREANDEDFCLLAYDEIDITSAVISADVRDVFERRPNTSWIYVLAPFQNESDVISAALGGTGFSRAGGRIGVLSYRRRGTANVEVVVLTKGETDSVGIKEAPLPPELQHGWLFDLFDSRRGRVEAPLGVHFGKTSGKHSDKFLRTSGVLLSSVVCAVVAFFSLTSLPVREVRRIFVDTAPLLSVVFSMQRIALQHGFWTQIAPTQSFSSYGGLDELPTLNRNDLVLVSASTSGNLADKLIGKGVADDFLLTLFLLKSTAEMSSPGGVVCDLTFRLGRQFGYPPIQNQLFSNCTLCKKGYFLAQLEGDQFMLEKRSVKRLRVTRMSQSDDARKALESIARKGLISVDFYRQDIRRTNVRLDVTKAIKDVPAVATNVVRLLMRFTPVPVGLVVLIEIEATVAQSLIDQAGLGPVFQHAKMVSGDSIGTISAVDNANVLVLVGCLWDHAKLRGINAQLRTKASRGCVAYLCVFTMADSARNLADLRTFLSFGEFGKETFLFRSATDLMLPWLQHETSAWDDEVALLRRMASETGIEGPLVDRLTYLENATSQSEGLFLDGLTDALRLSPDFVYLDTTKEKIVGISQADVYAVVANLLASVRCNNIGLVPSNANDAPSIQWNRSLYGQVLLDPATLCPRNFRDYNDAILRAAFLRVACKQELNFAVDEECSLEVLDVILADVDAWADGRGDSLPEFLMSLACGRMRLQPSHTERLKDKAGSANLPPYMGRLLQEMPRE